MHGHNHHLILGSIPSHSHAIEDLLCVVSPWWNLPGSPYISLRFREQNWAQHSHYPVLKSEAYLQHSWQSNRWEVASELNWIWLSEKGTWTFWSFWLCNFLVLLLRALQKCTSLMNATWIWLLRCLLSSAYCVGCCLSLLRYLLFLWLWRLLYGYASWWWYWIEIKLVCL